MRVGTAEHLLEWVSAVTTDQELSSTSKTILCSFAVLYHQGDYEVGDDKSEFVFAVNKPEIIKLIGLTKPTFYRNWDDVLASDYLEVVGTFSYQAGTRIVESEVVVLTIP